MGAYPDMDFPYQNGKRKDGVSGDVKDKKPENTESTDIPEKVEDKTTDTEENDTENNRLYILVIILICAAGMFLIVWLVNLGIDHFEKDNKDPENSQTTEIAAHSEGADGVENPSQNAHQAFTKNNFKTIAVENDFYKLEINPWDDSTDVPDDGFYLNAEVENKSDNINIQLLVDYIYLDSLRVNSFTTRKVDAGESEKFFIMVDASEIENLGYGPYSSINIHYTVSDTDGDPRVPLEDYTASVYSEDENDYDKYVRSESPMDVELIDSEEINLICTGTDKDDKYNYLDFYLENRTEQEIDCTLDEFEMDGNDVGGIFETKPIDAGCSAEFELGFSISEYGEIRLSELENIEFSFSVEDEDEQLLVDDEPISIHRDKRKVSHDYK